jgi:hypothetical protein
MQPDDMVCYEAKPNYDSNDQGPLRTVYIPEVLYLECAQVSTVITRGVLKYEYSTGHNISTGYEYSIIARVVLYKYIVLNFFKKPLRIQNARVVLLVWHLLYSISSHCSAFDYVHSYSSSYKY